jgi:hypothetical protein
VETQYRPAFVYAMSSYDLRLTTDLFPPIQNGSVSAGCADLRLTTTAIRQPLVNA